VTFSKLSVISILALLLVASVLWATRNNTETATVPLAEPSTTAESVTVGGQQSLPPHMNTYGVRTPVIPSGAPGIQPREELVGLGPSVPTFTEQDVRDAINRAGARGWVDGVDPKIPPTITSVRFLTQREYSASKNGANSGQPDDTLLCVVELAGGFTVMGPPHAGNETCERAKIIFHGHTGNQLGYSIACGE
jgi:hypothetical protein